MWCRTCQQDVPAVASTAEGAVVCCARCGEPFEPVSGSYLASLEHDLVSPREDSTADDAIAHWVMDAPPDLDELVDFEIEADLRRIEQVVQRFRDSRRRIARVDGEEAHAVPSWHVAAPARKASAGQRIILGLSWVSLAIGLMGFMCGGVLALFAVWQQRTELWPVALPALIVGQFLLLLGLVGLYDVLWRQRHSQADPTERSPERQGWRAEEGHLPVRDRSASRGYRRSARLS